MSGDVRWVWGLLTVLGTTFGVACGAAPNADELERSRREFQLAASLREEGSQAGAIEHLRRALELDDENARAYLLLGYIYMQRDEFAQAEPNLRKGVKLLETVEPQAATLAEARDLLGVALIHLDRFQDAEKVLREAATDVLNHSPHYAWGNLGLAYYRQGKHDEALGALKEAVRLQPYYCVGYYRIGQVEFARGEFDHAEDALTRALEVDQRCSQYFQDAWRLRGETRARMGHRDEALSDLERCVELGELTDSGQFCKNFLEAGI